MTSTIDMQINTPADFAQLRMEFDQYRSAYLTSLEAFIAANAGRIKVLKWEIESIHETADAYAVSAIVLERDDGQSLDLSSPHSVESREVEWDAYSDGGTIAEIVSKLQYNGIEDDKMVDAAFAKWAGVPNLIGLSLADAMFEWVRAQPHLADKGSIEISDLQDS